MRLFNLEDVGLGLKDLVAERFSVCLGGILVEYAQPYPVDR